jgi:hypothetical protein
MRYLLGLGVSLSRALLVSIGDAAYQWRYRTRQITALPGLRDIFEQLFEAVRACTLCRRTTSYPTGRLAIPQLAGFASAQR